MAGNTHLSIAAINAGLDAAINKLNIGAPDGFLDIYTGTQPANPNVAVTTQVKLAHLPLSATSFAAAVNGTKTANAIATAAALATGVATWFRATDGNGLAVIDGNVGLAAALPDLVLSSVSIVFGGPAIQVTSWTITWPQ